jgi:hypothetical protein
MQAWHAPLDVLRGRIAEILFLAKLPDSRD